MRLLKHRSRCSLLALGLVFVWFGIEFVDFAWYRSELAELPLWLIHHGLADCGGVTWLSSGASSSSGQPA